MLASDTTAEAILAPIVVNQLGPVVGEILRDNTLADVRDELLATSPWEVSDAEILLTAPTAGWINAPSQRPPSWPGRLRWVQIASAGIDGFPDWMFEVEHVTCGRGITAVPIAEYVLGALLLHEKRFDTLSLRSVADFPVEKHLKPSLGSLSGKTLGIAGFGAIGQAVGSRAQAFDMDVIAWRRTAWQGRNGVKPATDLFDLVSRSDYLVLALPLTNETRHIIGRDVLAHAKPGLHLVNVARGGLLDHEALLAALNDKHVGFATLDVTEPEPLPAGHPFYSHSNVRLTPHVSWSDEGSRARLAVKILKNYGLFLKGEPLIDAVDLQRGY